MDGSVTLPSDGEALSEADLAGLEAEIASVGRLEIEHCRRLIEEIRALNHERSGLLAALRATRRRAS